MNTRSAGRACRLCTLLLDETRWAVAEDRNLVRNVQVLHGAGGNSPDNKKGPDMGTSWGDGLCRGREWRTRRVFDLRDAAGRRLDRIEADGQLHERWGA